MAVKWRARWQKRVLNSCIFNEFMIYDREMFCLLRSFFPLLIPRSTVFKAPNSSNSPGVTRTKKSCWCRKRNWNAMLRFGRARITNHDECCIKISSWKFLINKLVSWQLLLLLKYSLSCITSELKISWKSPWVRRCNSSRKCLTMNRMRSVFRWAKDYSIFVCEKS